MFLTKVMKLDMGSVSYHWNDGINDGISTERLLELDLFYLEQSAGLRR